MPRRRLPDAHGGAAGRRTARQEPRWCCRPSIRSPSASARWRIRCSAAHQQYRRDGLPAQAAQVELHPHADAGAAAVAARGVCMARSSRRSGSCSRSRTSCTARAPSRKGDLDTRLPLTSHDDMGFLVHSFNDMTKRLRRAREEAARSQQAVETERANLAVDPRAPVDRRRRRSSRDLRVRVANQAASSDPRRRSRGAAGAGARRTRRRQICSRQFARRCRARLRGRRQPNGASSSCCAAGSGRRVLMCACTPLPGEGDAPGGYVLVFDDITVHAAGAARGGLGRGGATPRARDQEPADADPALGRAHAAQAAAVA